MKKSGDEWEITGLVNMGDFHKNMVTIQNGNSRLILTILRCFDTNWYMCPPGGELGLQTYGVLLKNEEEQNVLLHPITV